MEQQMEQNKKRGGAARRSGGLLTVILLVVAVMVLNTGVFLIPNRVARVDLTEEEVFTVSEKTEQFLRELSGEVTVYVLDADGSNQRFEYFLQELDGCGKNLTI